LDQKPGEAEGILIEHNPSAISDQLGNDTCADGRRKEPGSMFDSYQGVDKQGNKVERNESRVGCY